MSKKKKQTVGYKYFASAHIVLCHGPVDSITKITFQDKEAHSTVESANKTIYIDKPSLFGGDDQQGGIQGNFELLFGRPDQEKSLILSKLCRKISDQFEGLVSAWRGVTSVVFDSVYIGTSPSLPDSKWQVRRIFTQWDGSYQWYSSKAEIITTHVNNVDMNPAHIIRECLVSKTWGIGISESNIDYSSFFIAADKLHEEDMGISIKWTDSTSINDFIDNIKDHINARLYLDRITNKWKLYLIRDDYDVDNLILLNESNIRNLDFERRTLAECVNAVTVTYYDRERSKNSTVTVQDIARIAQQGGVVSQAIEYEGFTNSDIAGRVALRDLKTLSSNLASVSFEVEESLSESWHDGMPFKLSDSSYGLSDAVMRIKSIKRGNGINNTVYVEAIEDSFSSPMQSVIPYDPPILAPSGQAMPASAIGFEVPYIELVEQFGQDEVDAKLNLHNELGYAGMAAIRPNNQHINGSVYIDSGAGYDERTSLDFCPSASLKDDIGYLESSFELENVAEFGLLKENHRIQINDEIMGFVSFDALTNVITVKRGCFDTLPQKHDAGSRLFGWDDYSAIDNIEHIEGEIISLKLLTQTSIDQLSLSEATAHQIKFNARAIRPYPPANVKINDQYYPQDIETDLILTWVDRNRLQETGGAPLGFFCDGVGIEANTQTHLILTEYDENQIELATNNVNVTASNMYTLPISSMQADTKTVEITLKTIRDGHECSHPFKHIVELSQFFSAPYDLSAVVSEL